MSLCPDTGRTNPLLRCFPKRDCQSFLLPDILSSPLPSSSAALALGGMDAMQAARRTASLGVAMDQLQAAFCSSSSISLSFGRSLCVRRSGTVGAALRGAEECWQPGKALRVVRITTSRRSCALRVSAISAPLTSSSSRTSVPGFTQLGEEVPEGLTLQDVVKSLPKDVFQVDDLKAFKTVVITVTAVTAGYVALALVPWYLYPLVYAYLGTAVTGLFVIGHDCGHNSFSRSQLVNDVVGTIMMAPLIYPFEPWRIKHNTHHAHTNKLIMDTAWQPFRPHQYDRAGAGSRLLMKAAMGPLWWLASIGHWLLWHFDVKKYKPVEQPKVKLSLAAVVGFGVFFLGPLLLLQGPIGFIKWWLLPWLGFHFWMSTFTLVHHTAPHIPFKQSREWSAVAAQLNGTVHCEYPAWVDFLCHDISVHIPHHISTRIPSYNLRMAYDALQANWDKHLNKAVFGLPLMSTIVSECNLFDAEKRKWVKFDKSAREFEDAATPPSAHSVDASDTGSPI